MKKKMFLRDFKEYCAKNQHQKFIFYTEDQDWFDLINPCKVQLSFPSMTICENPNLICLQSEVGSLCLDQVRFVEIDTKEAGFGVVITICCGGKTPALPKITYKVIAA